MGKWKRRTEREFLCGMQFSIEKGEEEAWRRDAGSFLQDCLGSIRSGTLIEMVGKERMIQIFRTAGEKAGGIFISKKFGRAVDAN